MKFPFFSGRSGADDSARALMKEIKRLGEARRWYQYIDFGNGVTTESLGTGNMRHRTVTFAAALKTLPLTAEDRVLDIGCNAGLFSLLLAERCADVVGIEIDPGFYAQALFVKRFWEQSGQRVGNVAFHCGSVLERLDLVGDRTVLLASKVLYHKFLGDGVFDLMAAVRDSAVRIIVVQGHTTQGERGQQEGVERLLRQHGFGYRVILEDEEYPIGIAERL